MTSLSPRFQGELYSSASSIARAEQLKRVLAANPDIAAAIADETSIPANIRLTYSTPPQTAGDGFSDRLSVGRKLIIMDFQRIPRISESSLNLPDAEDRCTWGYSRYHPLAANPAKSDNELADFLRKGVQRAKDLLAIEAQTKAAEIELQKLTGVIVKNLPPKAAPESPASVAQKSPRRGFVQAFRDYFSS